MGCRGSHVPRSTAQCENWGRVDAGVSADKASRPRLPKKGSSTSIDTGQSSASAASKPGKLKEMEIVYEERPLDEIGATAPVSSSAAPPTAAPSLLPALQASPESARDFALQAKLGASLESALTSGELASAVATVVAAIDPQQGETKDATQAKAATSENSPAKDATSIEFALSADASRDLDEDADHADVEQSFGNGGGWMMFCCAGKSEKRPLLSTLPATATNE